MLRACWSFRRGLFTARSLFFLFGGRRIQKKTRGQLSDSFGLDRDVKRRTRLLPNWQVTMSKASRKALLRFLGSVCALGHMGTVFAALRSLFSSDLRQRQAQMDLKGMRMVDCTFLTMSMAALQAYIGMSCSDPGTRCDGYSGFSALLVFSCTASILSSSLAHLQMDLNVTRLDVRPGLLALLLFTPPRQLACNGGGAFALL